MDQPVRITLTEPVVFLRTPDPSGHHQPDPTDPPTLVRGILSFHVFKPIGISTIEVELTGELSINYPEAIGVHRVELPERHKIYSSTVTVFRADQVPRGRHSASVGPGLSSANRCEDERTATTSARMLSLPRGRSDCRGFIPVPLDLGPSPPYTVIQSSPTQPTLGTPEEQSNQREQSSEILDYLLRSLMEERRPRRQIPPSCRSSIALSPPNPTTHSDASSISNDSIHREGNNRTDHLVPVGSFLECGAPSHNAVEEPSHVQPHRAPSPSLPDRALTSEHTNGTQSRKSCDVSNAPQGHSRLRLSLTSVLDAVKEIASRVPSRSRSMASVGDRERGRTRARVVQEEQRGTGTPGLNEAIHTGNDSQLGPNGSCSSGHTEHREHHLFGLGRILGLERDHEVEKEYAHKGSESWREFMPGTYSYPISFLLPAHLPPTFTLPNGSLSYAINGVVHRHGTFVPRLSCRTPLLVVATPAIGTGEAGTAGDPGPLLVEKQWQTKFAYSFGLSSRLFLLGSEYRLGATANESPRANSNTDSSLGVGVEARADAMFGTAVLDLTFLPIEKIKIWRLDLAVDQRVRYTNERGRRFRGDDVKQVKLLTLQDTCSPEEMDRTDEERTRKNKHKQKHGLIPIPLLPTPISPHRSPLLRFLPSCTDPSVLAGPGPYTLSTNIGLPGCNTSSGGDSGPLHFTLRQKSSNVKVEHTLRLVLRVESIGEDDTNNDCQGEKKFDIAVQTPITILSCRCVPEQQTLPRYSPVTRDSSQDCVACPCQPSVGPTEQGHSHGVENHLQNIVTPTPASFDIIHPPPDEQDGGHDRSRPPSRAEMNCHPNLLAGSLHPGGNRSSSSHAQPRPHAHHHRHAHSHSYSVSTSYVRSHSQTPACSTPHMSRPPSPLAQYERLVSGLESEAGEAPPSYDSVAPGSRNG